MLRGVKELVLHPSALKRRDYLKIIKPYHVIETKIVRNDILKHLEKCGRTCYLSGELANETSAGKFVKKLVTMGHESVLEHQSISVRFITNRGVTHELVRHRICSFSQESTRYCNYGKDKFDNQLTFIQPVWMKQNLTGEHEIKWNGIYGSDTDFTLSLEKPNNRWFWNCANTERDYLRLLQEGWTPEEARDVLTNSIKTEIVVTANLREWRAIFKQRCTKFAHPEIRELMLNLHNELNIYLPEIFDDLCFNE